MRSIDAIIRALNNLRPVVVAISIFQSFETGRSPDGVVPVPDLTRDRGFGGHAVLIVGYHRQQQLFCVRNSWGSNWGNNGYFFLPFGYFTAYDGILTSDLWTIDTIDPLCGGVQCVIPGARARIFSECNFLGASMELYVGVYNIGSLFLPDNSISSIVVPAGLTLYAWDQSDWKTSADALTLKAGNYPCLADYRDARGTVWDNRITAIAVVRNDGEKVV